MLEDYESQLVSLTAGEEVAFSLLNHGFPPEEAEERTRLALEDVGLPGRESYQLDELSGGQRQRLALASLL
ncbi:MAG: ABC transporter ATP-binding protein, partial [Succiniclasticum sp.]|nr:ABC transporter ATP-binding protein [Succiniclasticum sp.]